MSWEGPDPVRDEDAWYYTTAPLPESPPAVSEGSECPTCHRRVPHARKKSTPKSEPLSFRAPLGEKDSFWETVDAAAKHCGLFEKPYHRWGTLLKGLVLLLQEPAGGEEG